MDDFDYTDEGIPVFHSRKQTTSSKPGFDTIVCDTPSTKCSKSAASASYDVLAKDNPTKWPGNLVGIFEVDNKSYDVVMTEDCIRWTPLTGTVKRKSSSRKKKKVQELVLDSERGEYVLQYKDILGAKIKRERRANQKPGQGVCLGMAVFVYELKEPNKLRDRVILFGHPSEEICVEWVGRLQSILKGRFKERPKNIKVFLQPFAGKKDGRSVYMQTVYPLMEAARIKVDCTDVMHNEQIKQEMIHIDLDEYDSIVCIGGDGTAMTMINHLLNKVQDIECRELRPGFTPAKLKTPIGIIPVGTTNHVIHSLHGINDVVTSTIHIILGNKYPVDICSTYQGGQFYRWSFNNQYGFSGNVLTFLNRYKLLGEKRLEAAFLKSLTKSKLRGYDIKLQYLPSTKKNSHPKDGAVCCTGCCVCEAVSDKSRKSSVYSDELEEFDPLDDSNSSSVIADLSKENPYKTVKGTYMNIGVLTLSGRCDFAPQGISKFTHSGDGCMDVILVKEVDRKEFLRFLKRQCTSKNQLDLPFVECYRCTEVTIRPRLPTTWQHKDFKFNEIDYEMQKKSEQNKDQDNEIVLDELVDNSDIDSENEYEELSRNVRSVGGIENASFYNDQLSNSGSHNNSINADSTSSQAAPTGNVYTEGSKIYVTELEREAIKMKKKYQEMAEKKQAKIEAKASSVWNMDNTLVSDQELEFRSHPQLLTVYGLGVSPKTESKEVKLGWLPRI